MQAGTITGRIVLDFTSRKLPHPRVELKPPAAS